MCCEFLLAESDAGAGFLVSGGQDLDLGASLGERGLLGFGALETGELFIFEAVCLRGFKVDLVLDGFGLRGSLYGVELFAEAGGLLAVICDLSFKAGAERLLATEDGGGFRSLTLCGCESNAGLSQLGRQSTHLLGEAGTLKFDSLQLYEVFNQWLHPCQEGYGIGLME